ncbi:hypothetical protein CHU92_04930 [Flavobacterium cyanobacteriorum]|uniref:DUF4260 domain-containing protein n=1 Tax=Flavobacterium cyanobacteriorum TaxID=2022802 RepID=A0A255ZD38_9FLAO|nr:DUF4260 domain-containing protein [Flavobacterium cyanobacteriorum]OYQ38510.1 hypothetical protein CHU92_04930 [Flavobacterium cyanobacteriorum]
MNTLIKLEEAAMFALGIYLFSLLHYQWWWFAALILAPDIGMLGYIAGNKAGAWSYNLFHHTGVAVLIYLLGIYAGAEPVKLIGIILFSHSAMDRMMGYGLKYEKGFKFTHLGEIGR